MTKWQPIATAPRAPADSMETVEVLACYGMSGFIEVMYWSNGWWPANHDVEEPWSDPSHWMPLPDPPSDHGETGDGGKDG